VKKVPDEEPMLKEKTKREPVKKEPVKESKEDSRMESASADTVRDRLLQSAVERAKARTESSQKPSKGEVLSSGSGEGEGAAALGPGGRGGPGIVKGMDFIIYQNRMLSTIKDNWAWVGQRSSLKVVVHFGIRENGEIVGLKVVQPSGDSSYDESVLRAVKKSSPLPAPPENYRKDFSDVELTFRPRDLGA
jgi:TolA protein